MSERIELMKKARARMADDRDAFVKMLAGPFDRDNAERARNKFMELQAVVEALDRAIAGERATEDASQDSNANRDQRLVEMVGAPGLEPGTR